MAASEVRAGRAFVELFTKDGPLVTGLRKALRRVRQYAEQAKQVGSRVAVFGAATSGGLLAVVRSFQRSAVAMARLRDQTGLTADQLSGLTQAASEIGLEFEDVRQLLSDLQDRVGDTGAEMAEQFARIGLSIEDLRKRSTADAFSSVVDALERVPDPATRAHVAMALFGDVGARLIPILLRGTRGLDEAAQRARDLGSAFSDDALDAAVDLGAATNGLVTSMRALKDGIGATLTTVVRPLVEGVTRVVQATANWVRENPALVQSLFNITVAVGALGTAVAALAGVVLALTSPLVVTVALLGTVAAAAFAVTDALGVTSTGFGDLFNSIRIGGQGLATWMARLWSFIVEGWEYVRFSIESAWDGLVTVARRVGGFLYDAFASVVGPIADVFGGLFDWLGDAFDAVFGWIVRGVQKLVGWIADAFSWLWENTIGAILDSDQADAAGAGQPGFTDRQAERRRALSQALEDQKRRRDELDQLDPVDEAAGVLGFDAGRARKGLEAIGANLGEAVKDALDQLGAPGIELAQTANVFAGTAPIGPAALLTGAQVGEQATRTAQAAEVLGTFNASTAGQFGFGQRTEQQQLDAARETARNTRELLREFRNASQDRLL